MTKGICHICKEAISQADVRDHLQKCVPAGDTQGLRILAKCIEKPDYWLVFDIPVENYLTEISAVVNQVWFYGQIIQSRFFRKAHRMYINAPDPDAWLYANQGCHLTSLEIGECFRLEYGVEFKYASENDIPDIDEDSDAEWIERSEDEYFGSEKLNEDELIFERISTLRDGFVPDPKMVTTIEFEVLDSVMMEINHDRDYVNILIRNQMPEIPCCEVCGKPATNAQIYRTHTYLCDDCINPDECMGLPLINSPRMGVFEMYLSVKDVDSDFEKQSVENYQKRYDAANDEAEEMLAIASAASTLNGEITLDEFITFYKHYHPDCTYTKEKFEYLLTISRSLFLIYEKSRQCIYHASFWDSFQEKPDGYSQWKRTRNRYQFYYPKYEELKNYRSMFKFAEYIESKCSVFLSTFIESTNYSQYFSRPIIPMPLLYRFWLVHTFWFLGLSDVNDIEFFLIPITEGKVHITEDDYARLLRALNELIRRLPEWRYRGHSFYDACERYPEYVDRKNPWFLNGTELVMEDYVNKMTKALNEADITKPFVYIKKVNRNDPCPCGSGKKYKKCHGKTV